MQLRTTHFLGLLISASAVVTVSALGCESNRAGFDGTAAPTESGAPAFGSDGGDPVTNCSNLECKQVSCSGDEDTTVTGTVYAPNGELPLYNAIVYVPNAELEPVTAGATCDPCGAVTGSPLVTAISGPDGKFTLKHVPVGKDIPLVIQVGKWRRKVTIPKVASCTENHLSDRDLTRLPKNQSEGTMPHIALTTGECDGIPCMLPKVGIDASEFGTAADGASKAVHVFRGGPDDIAPGPPAAPLAQELWGSAAVMKNYDMLILSCECSENLTNKGGSADGPAFTEMAEYFKAGGRIFTTDYMYTWYRYSGDPDLRSAAAIRGNAHVGGMPMSIDTSFAKGKALSDWLSTVIPGSGGNVSVGSIFANIISVDPAKAQQWATSGPPFSAPTFAGPRVFSVNVPVGVPAEQQCGKAVHVDFHVNDVEKVTESYPVDCRSKMQDSENLLAFFFFDLASCIQKESDPPKPPPVK